MNFDNALSKINGHLIDLAHAALDRFEAQTIAAAQEALANVDKLFADEVKSAAEPVMAWALSQVRVPIRELADSLTRYISEALRGTPAHDAVLVTRKHATDEQKLEAIHCLAASKAFSRRALFHPSRWAALADAFSAYCAERELTAEQAWVEIVRAALIFGIDEADRKAGEKPLIEFWHTARREVRREIEKTILDGRTLDRRGEVELPEDENAMPYWFDFEPEGELGEREAELLRRLLDLLTMRELQALTDYPTDNASVKARKRAMDKIRRGGLDLQLQSAETLKRD
jgi:hypothetical protein